MEELTKDDWYILLEEDFKRSGDKYDTLKVLSIHKMSINSRKLWRCNYKATKGEWSTSFGVYDVDKDDIPTLLRELKIKKILSK